MSKKIICVALCIVLVAITLAACGKKEKDITAKVDDSTNPTVIETVTDEQGEAVTDASGEIQTEIFEQVPVTDNKGEQVTKSNGEKVTNTVPATTQKEKNTGSSLQVTNKQNGSTTTTTKQNGKGSTITTTKPVVPPTTPSSTTTTKPTNPTKPAEKPTEKPATRPTNPTKPTEKPTTPSTKPTDPPTVKPTDPPIQSKDAAYFVQYAIDYGKSIGLTCRTDYNKDNGSWDNPMDFRVPVQGDDIEYYQKQIKSRLNRIKREGNSYFWVELSNKDFDGNPMSGGKYYLYIGY